MPRRARVFFEGALYHVYARATRREGIFAERREAEAFCSLLRGVKRRDGLVVLAWCVMTTHVHLLLRTAEVPLWRSMRTLQGNFAVGFNRRHQLVGPVWQSRYKAKLVDDDRYLKQLVAYIHLNPVTGGLVKNPATHRWNGHRELERGGGDAIIDRKRLLAYFGTRTSRAWQAYQETLRSVRGEEWVDAEPGRLPWWLAHRPPLGEAEAGARTVAKLPRDRPPIALDALLERACSVLGVTRDELGGRGQDQRLTWARECVVLVATERYGHRLKEVALAMGKSPESASRWISRAGGRRRAEEEFAAMIERLDDALSGEPMRGTRGRGWHS